MNNKLNKPKKREPTIRKTPSQHRNSQLVKKAKGTMRTKPVRQKVEERRRARKAKREHQPPKL